jgi:hypothetical protein
MRRSTIILILAALAAFLIAGCGSTQPGEQVSVNTGPVKHHLHQAKAQTKVSGNTDKVSCSKQQLTHGLTLKLTNTGNHFLATVCNMGNETVNKLMVYVHGELLGPGTSGHPDAKDIYTLIVNNFGPGSVKSLPMDYSSQLVSGHGQVTATVQILGPGAVTQFIGWTRRFNNGSVEYVPVGS